MRIATPLRSGAVALAAACALVPAAAQAKHGEHHGLACGKGHVHHSRALGHRCARHHGRHAQVQHTAASSDQQSTTTRQNAARECRAERERAGEQAFEQTYGTNANHRNAFGKCVAAHSRSSGGQDDDEISGNGSSSSTTGGSNQS